MRSCGQRSKSASDTWRYRKLPGGIKGSRGWRRPFWTMLVMPPGEANLHSAPRRKHAEESRRSDTWTAQRIRTIFKIKPCVQTPDRISHQTRQTDETNPLHRFCNGMKPFGGRTAGPQHICAQWIRGFILWELWYIHRNHKSMLYIGDISSWTDFCSNSELNINEVLLITHHPVCTSAPSHTVIFI